VPANPKARRLDRRYENTFADRRRNGWRALRGL